MRIVIRDARVLAMDGVAFDRANILIEDGTIFAVGPNVEFKADKPVDRVVEGAGHLVMPGLINGHFHSPVNHLKGALPSLPLEVFMLYESPPLDAAAMTPRAAYVRTMLGALEMLKNGVTAVQDDAFSFLFRLLRLSMR